MTKEKKRTGWASPLIHGFLAIALAQAVALLFVTGYAFCLAFQVRGAPNPIKVSQFAIHTAPWTAALTGIAFTFMLARRASRRAPRQPAMAGLLTGISAALCHMLIVWFFRDELTLMTAGMASLFLLAGWFAGSRSPCDSDQAAG